MLQYDPDMADLPCFEKGSKQKHISPSPLPSHEAEEAQTMLLRSAGRRHRSVVIAFATLALCYLFWPMILNLRSISSLTCGNGRCNENSVALGVSGVPGNRDGELVPLEAHIMSKCPDAQDCLKMMVLPTMQRVYDKVNFTLSFIGTPTENDGVECKHGPGECMGNIIELCAQRLYPDPKIYLGFTMCLTRDYMEIPDRSLIEDCALEQGIDFGALNECAIDDNGGLGIGMLRESVHRSTAAGVTKSCTVRLDEQIYCIRDGGIWKECPHGAGVNDLVIEVEKLWRSRSSSSEAQKSHSIAR